MNPVELPSAGLHYGVPYEQYAKWPAVNFSTLKPIRGTASKCKYALDHPKAPTPAMVLGSSLHVAVLEPARFDQLFFICPPCDRRTAEGKEAFAKYEKEAGSRLLIRSGSKEDESTLSAVADLRGMAASIRGMKSVAPFLNGPGQNEVSALWRDEETGLWCKGRFDRLIPSFDLLDGIPVIVEIKTTKDASAWDFAKDVDSLGYAAQSSCYRSGYKKIAGVLPAHVFIVAENFPPYDAAFYMLTDRDYQTGLLQYRQMLHRYAECVKTNHWPGYPDKCQTLSMPEYAHQRNYEPSSPNN